MIPPPPFDARPPQGYGAYPPSPFLMQAGYDAVQSKLRTAAMVTIAGGVILFFFSFFGGFFSLAFGNAAVGVWLLVLGLLPGIIILSAGAMMMRPGASVETWVWVTTLSAALALLSGGGLLIGSACAFVGAALARSALNQRPAYAPPSIGGPPPYAAPAYAPTASAVPPFAGYAEAPRPPYLGYGEPAAPAPYGYGGPGAQYGVPSPAYAPPPPPMPAPAPAPAPAPPPRPAWNQSVVQEFLGMDADRGFSLESLNLLDFTKLRSELEAGEADPAVVARVKARLEELLRRIDQDTTDLNTVDDILRDRAVVWYRDSPDDPAWAETRALAWSGLVSESHTAGGARTPALAARLGVLRDELTQTQAPVKRGFLAFRKPEATAAPPAKPSASLPALVVQAVLDDMAENRRVRGETLSLLRLAEVAAKATPAAVNQTLGGLFKADARGPVVLLHPSRYPGFEFVMIRLPPASAVGAAIAYEVVCAPPDAPAGDAFGPTPSMSLPSAAGPLEADVSPAVWQDERLDAVGWGRVLQELERRRDRLSPPPSNFRKLPSYFALRKAVLTDPAMRRTFLAVKWRGKPPGVGLVAQLLEERSLTPEVDTDGEYLEAELSDIVRGDADWRPPDLRWAIAEGVTVERAAASGALVYRVA